MSDALRVFAIYDRPLDYPEHIVVRGSSVTPRGIAMDPLPHALVATVDEARASLPPGLVCFGRAPSDDPKIVESWL